MSGPKFVTHPPAASLAYRLVTACIAVMVGGCDDAAASTHDPVPAGTALPAAIPANAEAPLPTAGSPASAPNSSSGTGSGVPTGAPSSGSIGVPQSCPERAVATDPAATGYALSDAQAAAVDGLLSAMSVAEKVEQMHGDSGFMATADNRARNLRGFRFRDGPRGVRMDNGGASTCFPVPSARGATFDPELERTVGAAIGLETLASGNTMILAPVINVLRHPAWGRAQETYGEDPFLLARMGVGFTLGAQTHVPACVKHYAANNVEDTRMTNNAVLDEQTLRENYLSHFRAVVQEGGAACVMAAYNRVNGSYCAENDHLLNDILKDEWGFRGFVLSDWYATHTSAPAVNAGLDLEMPGSQYFGGLAQLVPGQISNERLDDAARRIVEQKVRFDVALLDQALGGSDGPPDASVLSGPEHAALARKVATESMVLLKNDAHALPLDPATVRSIALVGQYATQARLGDVGSSNVTPSYAITPAQGITERAGSAVAVTTSNDASAAVGADVAVVVVALTTNDEGESINGAGDRSTFDLSAGQAALIQQTASMNEHVIVVLEASGPITDESMPWMDDVESIVMAWYPGMEGGNALADLLFGAANFSGRLPMTWPKRWEDEPAFDNDNETQMDYYHGYRHFDLKRIDPLYPFGFGLSYTEFSYANATIACPDDVGPTSTVDVQVDVANTGTSAGSEVAMLFVGYPNTSAPRRSLKELKGFTRVALAPGEMQTVHIPLRVQDLAYYDMSKSAWVTEAATYDIWVGPNARDLTLKTSLVVQ